MNSTTLRGVFPEQKPVHRRNFIKENMRYIKQIQGLTQGPDMPELSSTKQLTDKFRNVPPKVTSQFNAAVTKSKHRISQPSLVERSHSNTKVGKGVPPRYRQDKLPKPKLEIKQLRDFGEISRTEEVSECTFNEKITHRGIQTERNEDMNRLYDCGVIKYPSPSVLDQINHMKRKSVKVNQDHGDTDKSPLVEEKLDSLHLEEKPDYIRQNIQAVRQKSNRQDSTSTAGSLPLTYQKGALPKYLKERKDEQLKDVPGDDECPEGHVLLPDEERKETLRVLRQSYADRIQELNSMPVRNDTLRMRKRKMELEEELKKIDEGIKVFQRPKVFVKINA
ncbi:hypothetical protein AMK59_5489 [Oryctes borbonicus]|uniref:Enkurin domain-containing protein n=1 Tax=Oryctes borbonicus TaxID=1629725 RepID=A0A0T6AZV2_9SCAR|nr:hypothetical protein AMK59_5489 [Oryctes borbonicus]